MEQNQLQNPPPAELTPEVEAVRAQQAEDQAVLSKAAGGTGDGGVEEAEKEKVLTPEESLDMNVEEALRLAAESGENIYIVRCPLYANSYHEYDFGRVHVTGRKEEFATVFDKKDWMTADDWRVVGVVDPQGEVFLNEIPEILRRAFATPKPTQKFRVNDGNGEEVIEASDDRMAVARFALGYNDLAEVDQNRRWPISVSDSSGVPVAEYEVSPSGQGVQITKITEAGKPTVEIGLESETQNAVVPPPRTGPRR